MITHSGIGVCEREAAGWLQLPQIVKRKWNKHDDPFAMHELAKHELGCDAYAGCGDTR